MGDIDPSFIQPIEHRPKTVVEFDEIPVIDLSESEAEVVAKIGKACEEWGFFQVINHGVPAELCEKAKTVAKKFFTENSLEAKKKVQRENKNAMGYNDGEHTKDARDWKEVFAYLVEPHAQIPGSYHSNDLDLATLTNQWPQNSPQFRETLEEYAREVEKVAYKVLELVSLSLGLAGDKFHGCFKNSLSKVVLNYYPPCPFPDQALGVAPHTDSSAFTVVTQDDVVGLHVKRDSDGAWIPVKPIPNAFVVNLGEAFQVWSNDKYKSVEHVVTVNTKERLSIPFFFSPNHSVMVKPAEELINEKNPARYRGYNYGKYSATRSHSDFEKLGKENIQIRHFRIKD